MLTLFIAQRFFSPWWWRHYFPTKLRFLQESYNVTCQKTAFFMDEIFFMEVLKQQLDIHETNMLLNAILGKSHSKGSERTSSVDWVLQDAHRRGAVPSQRIAPNYHVMFMELYCSHPSATRLKGIQTSPSDVSDRLVAVSRSKSPEHSFLNL
jgi:hypothetical protein